MLQEAKNPETPVPDSTCWQKPSENTFTTILVCGQTRDPASNMVESQDQHPGLFSDLHMHTGACGHHPPIHTLCIQDNAGLRMALTKKEGDHEPNGFVNKWFPSKQTMGIIACISLGCLPCLLWSSIPPGVCHPKALGYFDLNVRVIFFPYWHKVSPGLFSYVLFWGKFMTFLTLGSFAFPDILLLCIFETFQSQTINIMRLLFSYEQAISSWIF